MSSSVVYFLFVKNSTGESSTSRSYNSTKSSNFQKFPFWNGNSAISFNPFLNKSLIDFPFCDIKSLNLPLKEETNRSIDDWGNDSHYGNHIIKT